MKTIRIERVRWGALWVGCGLLACVALAPIRLRADEGPERAVARQHFAQGVALAKRRLFVEALNEFQRAYAAVPHFSVLYNIGQAQVALGQSAEAVTSLQRYLDEGAVGVDARRRAEVQAIIERERAKAPPPEPAATLSAPATAASPPVEPAEAHAPAPVTSPAVSPPSASPPGASPPGASPPGVAAPPSPSTTGGTRAELARAAKAPSAIRARRARSHPAKVSSAERRTLAYVVAGAGVALSAAAFVHYSWNRGRYQQWKTKHTEYFRDPTERNRLATNQLSESIDNASAVTVVLGIGAGVALGTGTLLWLTSGAPGSEPQKRGLSPFFSAQGTF